MYTPFSLLKRSFKPRPASSKPACKKNRQRELFENSADSCVDSFDSFFLDTDFFAADDFAAKLVVDNINKQANRILNSFIYSAQ
jgi:hypothetical protein